MKLVARFDGITFGKFVILLAVTAPTAFAASITGTLFDPQGRAIGGAAVTLCRRSDSSVRDTLADSEGRYTFSSIDPGEYTLTGKFPGFTSVTRNVVAADFNRDADLHFAAVASRVESVTVAADISDPGVFAPDPAQRILIREETLEANPGRPGMPVSIPGMPVESPAGGIKPPQYFAPGVAGDHGEPVAMFFQVGGFLFPNNLPVNAHGNGYADPNIILPLAIETLETDGGSFNVREGNNSVNSAITFGLRDRIEPQVRLTADYRDLNLVGAWSPADPSDKFWMGLEISYGNGFLQRLEHRKQVKANVSKVFTFGRHDFSVYGTGYYGFAYQPGLIPIDRSVPGDTIDPRQSEETSNGALIVNDVWRLTDRRQFQFSGDYRYYTLDVRPNFGDGLIRQSERRNSNTEDVLFAEQYSKTFSLLAGVDLRREAPRALDLDRADDAGRFQPVTANNITINFYSPYVAADGTLLRYLHYNVGYRADEVTVNNQDLYRTGYSFQRRALVNSPKGTLTFFHPVLPEISISYGQAFHVDDPRIGASAIFGGTVVAKARSYQLVARKTAAQTEFRVTLAHVTSAQQLARISNDTGLQEDVGPGILRSITVTARRNFSRGFVEGLFARADARDRITGGPIPEAPRRIWGILGTLNRLPWRLVARAEFEEVGRKPLGDGFNAVPVRELRAAVVRPFHSFDVGLNLFLASGYGGQTLETLQSVEQITGFPLKSSITASFTYRIGR